MCRPDELVEATDGNGEKGLRRMYREGFVPRPQLINVAKDLAPGSRQQGVVWRLHSLKCFDLCAGNRNGKGLQRWLET